MCRVALCLGCYCFLLFFFFKQKTAYEMRISDWSSDVCSSDLMLVRFRADVVALKPQVVHIMAGTNDVAGNTGPTTAQDVKNNIVSMVELARANEIGRASCRERVCQYV